MFKGTRFVGLLIVLVVASMLLAGCNYSRGEAQRTEALQLSKGTTAIVNNQPVPNLGGYSLERALLSQLILLRNEKTATWSYQWEYGKLVEVCPSMGYPFPYATQLTAPEVYDNYNSEMVPQPEPNSLYSPPEAAASWVICMFDDQMVPIYSEDNVFALPYRIKADRVLERYEGAQGVPSVSMEVGANGLPVDVAEPTGDPTSDTGTTPEGDLTNPYPEDTGTESISPGN